MTSCDHRKQNNHHRMAVRSVGLFEKLCAIAEAIAKRDLLGDFYYFLGYVRRFCQGSFQEYLRATTSSYFGGFDEIFSEIFKDS